MPATTCSPMTSSATGACQPPNAKPPSVSSSGPPGACATPSSVVNRSMWMTPMVRPFRRGDLLPLYERDGAKSTSNDGDLVAQGFAAGVATQVVDEQVVVAVVPGVPAGRVVRREDDVRMSPQRARLREVARSASRRGSLPPGRPRSSAVTSAPSSTREPRAMFTSTEPSAIASRNVASTRGGVSAVDGRAEDDDVGCRAARREAERE